MTFDDSVEWKALGEVLENVSKIKWKEYNGKQFNYIDLSSVDRTTNSITDTQMINTENAPSRAQQITRENDIIYGTTRPTLNRYCIINKNFDSHICSTGFCVLRADTKKVLPKWIYFVITTKQFFYYIENNQKGASYPAISDGEIKKYKIPLPPIAEQQRIVDILDRFDSLCNDITKGLPAEIEARKKQYEYYRDKLLTFKELKHKA